MTEIKVEFKCEDGIVISGLLHKGEEKLGVVITHPHPLYGGDMYNNVVEALQRAYAKKKYSTLRFNFRGVGASSGRYDEGQAEQQDVLAACRFLKETGVVTVDLSGYSFGAWVNAGAAAQLSDSPMIMVSPPAAMLKFPVDLKLPSLKLVVTGSEDEFAPPDLISSLTTKWNPSARFEILDGADHFYWGYTEALEDILIDAI